MYVLSDMQIPYNYKIVPFYSFYIEKPEYAFDFAFVYQISRFFRFERKAKLFADESVFLARIMMRKGTEKGALFRLLLFLLHGRQLPDKDGKHLLSRLFQHPLVIECTVPDPLYPKALILLCVSAPQQQDGLQPYLRLFVQRFGQCRLPVFDTVHHDGFAVQV